ncbi:retropepsin-like aspartic protease family protein [Sphingomonas jaspsi]|uniref:retropepsin-like aspartic protease family protein n=1 Tax=Sphingomonas jaspsi TaxID=392409 RepID=UPI0004BBB6C6|nr:retropepsin-like aspartic protease [Sphingomonas jaspsi]
MTNDLMLGGLYVLMAIMLVFGALMTRREPWARNLTFLLAWLSIFGGGFVMFTFRDEMGLFAQRIRSEVTGEPVLKGRQVRIPQAIDGHFYVDARINGVPIRFLVDSGATVTTIGRMAAGEAGVAVSTERNQVVLTGNGVVEVSRGRAETLAIGPIQRSNMQLHIADRDELNVLGMNFLSSLNRWGVEGRWLVLEG